MVGVRCHFKNSKLEGVNVACWEELYYERNEDDKGKEW